MVEGEHSESRGKIKWEEKKTQTGEEWQKKKEVKEQQERETKISCKKDGSVGMINSEEMSQQKSLRRSRRGNESQEE